VGMPIYAHDEMQLGPEGMDQYEQGGGGGGGEDPFGGFRTEFRTSRGQQVDMEDIFQQFFGGQAYQPRRGPDLQVRDALLMLTHGAPSTAAAARCE
jgi:DnaJ-class molecular chaperone